MAQPAAHTGGRPHVIGKSSSTWFRRVRSTCKNVAHLFLEENTTVKNTQPDIEERLFEVGNEEELLKYFKDLPPIGVTSTSSATNTQQDEESSTGTAAQQGKEPDKEESRRTIKPDAQMGGKGGKKKGKRGGSSAGNNTPYIPLVGVTSTSSATNTQQGEESSTSTAAPQGKKQDKKESRRTIKPDAQMGGKGGKKKGKPGESSAGNNTPYIPLVEVRSTSSATNTQQDEESSTIGSTPTPRFDIHCCITLLRTFHALFDINLPRKRDSINNARVAEGNAEPGTDTVTNNNGNGKCCFWFASAWPVICYILMIIYTTLEGSLVSLVYPVLLLFWALLSSGKCHIWFWIIALLYTAVLLAIKNTSKQMDDIFWEDYYPRRIGVEKPSTFNPVLGVLLGALLIELCILWFYGASCLCCQKQDPEDVQQDMCDTTTRDRGNPVFCFRPKCLDTRSAPDVYWLAFSCDIILLVMLMGLKILSPSETIITYLSKEKNISWQFLTVCIAYLFLIIWERILYITGWWIGKLVLHVLLVIGLHAGIFLGLPWWHKQGFTENISLQAWYFIRCIAFALSAYQIKNGYPSHEHSHLLTKNEGVVIKVLFSVYLAIPFLMEIRTLLGWIFTDTLLTQRQWFQCEDIYTSLYMIKVGVTDEKGCCNIKLNCLQKCCMKSCFNRCFGYCITYMKGCFNKCFGKCIPCKKGGCGACVCVLFLIFIIVCPMGLFCYFTQSAQANPPTEATLIVSIGGYQPLFQTKATPSRSILPVTKTELKALRDSFGKHSKAGRFLGRQKTEDMSLITFDGVSLSTWGISTQSFQSLKGDLGDLISAIPGEFQFVVEVGFMRNPDDDHYSELKGRFSLNLKRNEFTEARNNLSKTLNGETNIITINGAFPRFLHLGRFAEVETESTLVNSRNGIRYSNLSLKHYRENNVNDPSVSWWDVEEVLKGPSVFQYEPNGDRVKVPRVNFITFNDKIVPVTFLNMLKITGMFALYTGIILAIGKGIRNCFREDHARLMFRELDNLDPLLRLVEALYSTKDSNKQKHLYRQLISLYADPVRMRAFTSV